MKNRKDPWEYDMKFIKCSVCDKCRVYINGPWAGSCIYGGPFDGYSDETQMSLNSVTLDHGLNKILHKDIDKLYGN